MFLWMKQAGAIDSRRGTEGGNFVRKQVVSLPIPAALALLMLLVTSLILNWGQYNAVQLPAPLYIQGSYCTDDGRSGRGEYFIFAKDGIYCRYLQSAMLEEGSYTEEQGGIYSLVSDDQRTSQLLLAPSGVYWFHPQGTVVYYEKFSTVLFYFAIGEKSSAPSPGGV